MEVTDFIRGEIVKPHQWGETDCCATADRWVQVCAGFSPLDRYGRRHRSRMDAAAWIDDDARRLARAVLAVMRRSGLQRTFEPQSGDVGLVRIQDRLVMGIFSGRLWFGRDEGGFMWACPEAVARAWKVPCRPR